MLYLAEILVPVCSVFNRLLAAQQQEVQVHHHPSLPQCALTLAVPQMIRLPVNLHLHHLYCLTYQPQNVPPISCN